MKTVGTFLLVPCLALGLALAAATPVRAWFGSDDADDAPPQELRWEELLPEELATAPDPFATMSREDIDRLFDGSPESNARLAELEESMRYAPTVPSLDGLRVKMPGYVVPLGFDGQSELSEFLLVSYFGACIHTPPPPANQVIHVESEDTVTLGNLYDPVWVIGTLHVESSTSELAEAGYRLDLETVEPYVEAGQ